MRLVCAGSRRRAGRCESLASCSSYATRRVERPTSSHLPRALNSALLGGTSIRLSPQALVVHRQRVISELVGIEPRRLSVSCDRLEAGMPPALTGDQDRTVLFRELVGCDVDDDAVLLQP